MSQRKKLVFWHQWFTFNPKSIATTITYDWIEVKDFSGMRCGHDNENPDGEPRRTVTVWEKAARAVGMKMPLESNMPTS